MTVVEEQWHTVGSTADIPITGVLRIELKGHEIAVYRTPEGFFATHDRCSHLRGRLSDGYLSGTEIQCPLHFGRFDVRSGQPLSPPCKAAVRCYALRVEGEALQLSLSRSSR